MLCLSGDFVYIYVKRWLGAGKQLDLQMQMLCLSGDFVCVYVKRWLGAGKQLDLCKCCACQGISCTST